MGKVVRNILFIFQLTIFKKVRGASHSGNRLFPNSGLLESCNFMGRPYVACNASSIAYFHSYLFGGFECL